MTPDERKRAWEWSVLVAAAASLEMDREQKWPRESPIFLQGFDTAIAALKRLAEAVKP